MQPGPDERANDGCAIEARPEAFRFGIEHQLVRAIQEPARAEHAHAATDLAVVRNDGPAQRAVDDRQLARAEPVTSQFVPGQDPFWIGPCDPVHVYAEHDVGIFQVSGLRRTDVAWVLERWNAIDRNPAPLHFVEPYRASQRCAEEFLEARIELAIGPALEGSVLGMGIVGKAPDPIAPTRHVGTEPLAGAIFKEASETTDAGPRRWRAQARAAHQIEDVDEQRCVAVLPGVRDPREGLVGYPI